MEFVPDVDVSNDQMNNEIANNADKSNELSNLNEDESEAQIDTVNMESDDKKIDDPNVNLLKHEATSKPNDSLEGLLTNTNLQESDSTQANHSKESTEIKSNVIEHSHEQCSTDVDSSDTEDFCGFSPEDLESASLSILKCKKEAENLASNSSNTKTKKRTTKSRKSPLKQDADTSLNTRSKRNRKPIHYYEDDIVEPKIPSRKRKSNKVNNSPASTSKIKPKLTQSTRISRISITTDTSDYMSETPVTDIQRILTSPISVESDTDHTVDERSDAEKSTAHVSTEAKHSKIDTSTCYTRKSFKKEDDTEIKVDELRKDWDDDESDSDVPLAAIAKKKCDKKETTEENDEFDGISISSVSSHNSKQKNDGEREPVVIDDDTDQTVKVYDVSDNEQ